MRILALLLCVLLCAAPVAGKAKPRRPAKRVHRGRIVRAEPCPVCVPLACPDTVKIVSQADAEEAERLKSAARRSVEEGDRQFDQQFTRWLAQHPELTTTPALTETVRTIAGRWYRTGREDGSKAALKLAREQ